MRKRKREWYALTHNSLQVVDAFNWKNKVIKIIDIWKYIVKHGKCDSSKKKTDYKKKRTAWKQTKINNSFAKWNEMNIFCKRKEFWIKAMCFSYIYFYFSLFFFLSFLLSSLVRVSVCSLFSLSFFVGVFFFFFSHLVFLFLGFHNFVHPFVTNAFVCSFGSTPDRVRKHTVHVYNMQTHIYAAIYDVLSIRQPFCFYFNLF